MFEIFLPSENMRRIHIQGNWINQGEFYQTDKVASPSVTVTEKSIKIAEGKIRIIIGDVVENTDTDETASLLVKRQLPDSGLLLCVSGSNIRMYCNDVLLFSGDTIFPMIDLARVRDRKFNVVEESTIDDPEITYYILDTEFIKTNYPIPVKRSMKLSCGETYTGQLARVIVPESSIATIKSSSITDTWRGTHVARKVRFGALNYTIDSAGPRMTDLTYNYTVTAFGAKPLTIEYWNELMIK